MPKEHEIISIPGSNETSKEEKGHGYGLSEVIGLRQTQQDAAYAGWFSKDTFKSLNPMEIGHRLWTSYKIVNEAYFDSAGSTASTTVYDGKGNIITATLGDTVAFAAVYGKNGEILGVVRLNKVIHDPTEPAERERIIEAGADIYDDRVEGRLSVSRGIGDLDCSGVCDEARIDITSTNEICQELNIDLSKVGSMQIITTCDGFTEPLLYEEPPKKSKKDHEGWLLKRLKEIESPGKKSQLEVAKALSDKALQAGSHDNVSIAIQTITPAKPFMMGIYDGHGSSNSASRFVARQIGEVFANQCAKSKEAYAEQRLSVDTNSELYSRDNQDILDKKQKRIDELAKAGGVLDKINIILAKAGETSKSSPEVKTAAKELCDFLHGLSSRYKELTIDKKELIACAKAVLSGKIPRGFKPEDHFIDAAEFAKQRKNVALLKKNHGYKQIMTNVVTACATLFVGYAIAAMVTGRTSVFRVPTKAGTYVKNLRTALDNLDETPKSKK